MRRFRRVVRLVPLPALLAATPPCTLCEVDPFIGVDGGSTVGGNTVPGAGIPFGFVSFSPDTANGDTNGYDSASAVLGFSYTHVSGTGGSGKYGNFRATPTVGPLAVNQLLFAKTGETASPGYYAVTLGNAAAGRVRVELTASRRVGFQRLTFPRGLPANLIQEATSGIALRGRGQRAVAARVTAIDARSFSGEARFVGGWNPAPYTLFFYAEVDRPAMRFGTWSARQGERSIKDGAGSLAGGNQTRTAANLAGTMVEYDTEQEFSNRVGNWLTFDTGDDPIVRTKLAISFTSVAQAKATLAAEMPGWDFDAARRQAEGRWRDVLDRIAVEGGTPAQRRIFRTALYHSMVMPHDVTGEDAGWRSEEPHYEDFYTLWDTFRTLHPLLTLIQPDRQRGMIRSLLETYRRNGWLPDGRIAGSNGMTQGGSNADIVIADAVVKGLGGFDLELAYQAIRQDGDVDSPRPFHEGRVLKDYLSLGYVPLSETRSASRTLEYAANDFAIAQVAARLGKTADAARYRRRAGGWRLLWDDALGCIRPRYADGAWLENYSCTYDYPDKTGPWWEAPFYEGNALQYSTYVPHDVEGLIAKVGGRARFVAWLDRLFDDGLYMQGNEPDFLAPWLYIHAGRPDRTAERVRHILATRYGIGRTGLPGNDDAGAMSSWYVMAALGLYPNAGQPLYYLGSPIFPRVSIALEGGRRFTIAAPATSTRNLYVQRARLNGRPLDRAWLSHEEVATGGLLELDMGSAPGGWGQGATPPNGL